MNKLIKRKDKKRKGFTLVELIVVIAILAVLSAAAFIGYSNVSGQARATAVNADGNAVARALNTYNALANTPITTLPPRTGAGGLDTLELKTADGDMINMQLSVSISEANYTAISPQLSCVNNLWTYTPVS